MARAVRAGGIALTILVGGSAQAEPQAGPQITPISLPSPALALASGGSARPVAAWVKFCERHAAECGVDTSEPAMITLTPQIWREIVGVNRRINQRIKPLTDQAHWGIADRWDFPEDGMGDCEDYQILKRKMLVDRGLPRRALRMTVVIDDQGEGHAVMMVRTDQGDFILDNKTSAVLSWEKTGYTYVKREGHDSMAWVSLGGVTSPITTANR